MGKRFLILVLLAALGLVFFLAVTHPYKAKVADVQANTGDIENGAYMFSAAGCANCHEAENPAEDGNLSGGHGLKSPFGTFYAPNITKVGQEWTEAEFIVALKSGVSPNSQHYFPSFPYTTYRHMKQQDISDMFAYIKTLSASETDNKEHDVPFPFSIRRNLGGWKSLFLGKTTQDFTKLSDDPEIQRGAYLVNAVTHCGECHSPRNALGAQKADFDDAGWLSGGKSPAGKKIPSLRPASGSLGEWSKEELIETLTTGFTPGFEMLVEGDMDKVVKDMAKLSSEDINAIAAYLMSLK